jgi:hypothetical protein
MAEDNSNINEPGALYGDASSQKKLPFSTHFMNLGKDFEEVLSVFQKL